MTKPKFKVDPKVPTRAIDRRLGRTHVGTPDAEVEAMIQEAIDQARQGKQADQWTDKIVKQTIRYALWRHHKNLAQYMRVMGGTAA